MMVISALPLNIVFDFISDLELLLGSKAYKMHILIQYL